MPVDVFPRAVSPPGVGGRPVPNSMWYASHLPGDGVTAAATKAAPGAGLRLLVSNITVVQMSSSAETTQFESNVTLAGAMSGTLWAGRLNSLAGGSSDSLVVPGVWLGGDNEALTLAFALQPPTETHQTVSMSGFVVRS